MARLPHGYLPVGRRRLFMPQFPEGHEGAPCFAEEDLDPLAGVPPAVWVVVGVPRGRHPHLNRWREDPSKNVARARGVMTRGYNDNATPAPLHHERSGERRVVKHILSR